MLVRWDIFPVKIWKILFKIIHRYTKYGV
jgi:hypothetical protein